MPPDELVAKIWTAPKVDAGDQITITVVGSDHTLGMIFRVPDGGIPTQGWLQASGVVADEACPVMP